MSFDAVKRPSSAFLALAPNRSMPRMGSLRTLMTSSTCGLEAAFSRMSRITAKEVSNISARLWYVVGRVGREGLLHLNEVWH